MENANLAFGELLSGRGGTVSDDFFANDSLISLLAVADPKHAIDVGMVGREGIDGISYELVPRRSSLRTLVHGSSVAASSSS